jgi:hypothetical protein
MTDDTARLARLMKFIEALVAELNRQGLAEIVADRAGACRAGLAPTGKRRLCTAHAVN